MTRVEKFAEYRKQMIESSRYVYVLMINNAIVGCYADANTAKHDAKQFKKNNKKLIVELREYEMI